MLRSPKNDDRDAFDVAARLRFGELPVSYVPSDFWQGLRRLTRYRYRLSKALSREKNRFQSYAFLKYSDWKRVKAFSDFFGATSIALLTEFTVAEVQEMTHDQLVDLITRRDRGRFADPTVTARAVRQALHTSYPIDPQMDEMVTACLSAGWDHIRYLKRSMKRLDRLIARYIDLVPNPHHHQGLGSGHHCWYPGRGRRCPPFPRGEAPRPVHGLDLAETLLWQLCIPEHPPDQSRQRLLALLLHPGRQPTPHHNLEYKAYYWRKYQEDPSISTNVPSSSRLASLCVWCMPCSQRMNPT